MSKGTEALVTELYLKKYKALKLPPAYVTALKKVMLTAANKRGAVKKDINAAAKVWLKEKAKEKKAKEQAKAPAKEKKAKEQAKAPAKEKKSKTPAKEKKSKTPAKEKKSKAKAPKSKRDANIEGLRLETSLTNMTKDELVNLADDRDLSLDSSATLSEIVTSVNAQLIGLDEGTLEILATIDETKLKDCVGIFISASTITCIKCPNQVDCLKKFAKHQTQGFKAFLPAADAEPAVEKVKKLKAKKVVGYALDQKIDVYDEPLDKKDPLYKLAKLVKKRNPETVGALQTLILSKREPEEDTDDSRAALTKAIIAIFLQWDLIDLA